MKIDPYTLVAQLLNFLILAGLLGRFVYRPVLAAVQQRDQQLAERLAAIEQREQQCQVLSQQLAERELQEQAGRDQARAGAEHELQQWRLRETDQIRQELAQQRRRWQENLQLEFDSLRGQKAEEVGRLVLEIARRALADLADRRLDDQIISYLLDHLPDGRLLQPVAMCAHELSAESRTRLAQAFPGVQFELCPELLGGVVLKDAQHRLGWSIQGYLEGLG
jgi:F-type H+-transporting ATPase subunit b